jgi:HTH-type transcriptional regulator, transcriptional repressor of NAD biosynthesis genes
MGKKRGLVIGKFLPPHKGHSYLIQHGIDHCDKLTVVVCHRDDQPIHGEMRAKWIRELHPEATVLVVVDIEKDDDSQAWADYTKKFLGYTPDIVFTSEDYGRTYCECLGCKHVLVDKARISVPVSGTKVRANPFREWDYISPCVRAHYAKRVCVVGAESTGTTTLAKDLAKYYKTNWAPEYGRIYSEGKLPNSKYGWRSDEFEHIARMQNDLEDYLARTCNKLLIADTDSFATSVWHERYMDGPSSEVEAQSSNREYDLYIITNDEIPFVQDGTRDGEHVRHKMHLRFIEKLKQKNKKFIIVSGSKKDRLKEAIKECDKVLALQTL